MFPSTKPRAGLICCRCTTVDLHVLHAATTCTIMVCTFTEHLMLFFSFPLLEPDPKQFVSADVYHKMYASWLVTGYIILYYIIMCFTLEWDKA